MKKGVPMSNESSLVLQANDISIVFGGLRAVSNFSCELKKGELVGLIGPNGAGKTTVFNMLSGIYKPTEGQINFNQINQGTIYLTEKDAREAINDIIENCNESLAYL